MYEQSPVIKNATTDLGVVRWDDLGCRCGRPLIVWVLARQMSDFGELPKKSLVTGSCREGAATVEEKIPLRR